MRYSIALCVVACWAIFAGLDASDLYAGVTSGPQPCPEMSQQRQETSVEVVEQGIVGEPKQLQLPPAGEPSQQLSPEERQRLEQAVEGTHLPGPKPSKGSPAQPEPGPDLVPPTSPKTPPEPDQRGCGGR